MNMTPAQRTNYVENVSAALDINSFAGITFTPESEEKDGESAANVLSKAELREFRGLHRRARQICDAYDKLYKGKKHPSQEQAIEFMFCVTICKISILIEILLECYAYYHDPKIKALGIRPHLLLDPNKTTDLCDALMILKDKEKLPEAQNLPNLHALQQAVYCQMGKVIDILNAFLPCKAVSDLRTGFQRHQAAPDVGIATDELNRMFLAVANQFADHEPAWEQQRQQPKATSCEEKSTSAKTKGKKSGRKGSGLHGPKKAKMDEQLDAFTTWVSNKQDSEKYTISQLALQFWNLNKKDFEKAANAVGEKKGYKNRKCLADAYRNEGKKK